MKAIQPGQRVQLVGSGLTGTTRDKYTVLGYGNKRVTKFTVKWDTGQTGTVNEDDIELYVIRSYKHQNS